MPISRDNVCFDKGCFTNCDVPTKSRAWPMPKGMLNSSDASCQFSINRGPSRMTANPTDKQPNAQRRTPAMWRVDEWSVKNMRLAVIEATPSTIIRVGSSIFMTVQSRRSRPAQEENFNRKRELPRTLKRRRVPHGTALRIVGVVLGACLGYTLIFSILMLRIGNQPVQTLQPRLLWIPKVRICQSEQVSCAKCTLAWWSDGDHRHAELMRRYAPS